MLKIYGHEGAANVRKVLWGVAELGLKFELVRIGGAHGPLDTPAYRALNPNARMPTIEEDGFVLWESHAILRYISARAARDDLYPTDLRKRAIVDQWLDWQGAHQAQAVRDLARAFAGGVPEPAHLAVLNEAASAIFLILERRLAQSPFVAADDFTIADIPVAIGFERWAGLPMERPALPATSAWFARVSARPSFAPASDPRR